MKKKRKSKKGYRCLCLQCKRRRARRRVYGGKAHVLPAPVYPKPLVTLGAFLIEGAVKGLFEWARANGMSVGDQHPEAMEPIETNIDERQLGRSEVIREIATPKKN